MYSFKNDYSEGAHPKIIDAIVSSNLEQSEGYGKDSYSEKASDAIKSKLDKKDVDIHFLPGGTQTNLTAIASFLKPYEAVISANTGHVLVHETGAIECTGHKVISVDCTDGKLKKEDIIKVINEHTDEHMVKPKMVYISNSTEIGTIYKKQELKQLSDICKINNLILYMDGARLGSALCSKESDLTLKDIASLTDAFYIGGTKNGALFGEALVICNDNLKNEFRFNIKQRGAMLAKGRLLGIQFLELFKDNLFFEIGNHENNMAEILKKGISNLGYKFFVESSTNQLFPILENEIIDKLSDKYSFSLWCDIDKKSSCIRLVTSWATKKEDVLDFISNLEKYTIN